MTTDEDAQTLRLQSPHGLTVDLSPARKPQEYGPMILSLDGRGVSAWRFLSRDEAIQLRDHLSSLLSEELEKAA